MKNTIRLVIVLLALTCGQAVLAEEKERVKPGVGLVLGIRNGISDHQSFVNNLKMIINKRGSKCVEKANALQTEFTKQPRLSEVGGKAIDREAFIAESNPQRRAPVADETYRVAMTSFGNLLEATLNLKTELSLLQVNCTSMQLRLVGEKIKALEKEIAKAREQQVIPERAPAPVGPPAPGQNQAPG